MQRFINAELRMITSNQLLNFHILPLFIIIIHHQSHVRREGASSVSSLHGATTAMLSDLHGTPRQAPFEQQEWACRVVQQKIKSRNLCHSSTGK
jgi:hypothetical protein